ncbi:hypothetical protein WS97_19545 [Burkholderia territorii]|uniref:fimbria/pilus periplasmic chaperone n=1 Tax=Burkholderia territorii TaxID=1503055 RepID=UPI000759A3BC|nr:fimbria/pilus periplasmic chaperone [Burkholderia territorii]KVL33267.1 hypothetical protein WS97_19545 [Burkholderia territorii]
MTNVSRYAVTGLLAAASLLSARSEAGVTINGTRIVYPAESKEVTVRLGNPADAPIALVQVWLDDGDEKASPETAKVPFVVMPPLFRIEPGKGQAVRLLYTKAPLPADKESLFWFNLLDVPPKAAPDAEGRNILQFALRTRIKMFFRPAGLPGTPEGAPEQVEWKLVPAADANGVSLQARNPTPYYVNYASVAVTLGGHTYPSEKRGGMVAPGGTTVFEVQGLPGHAGTGMKVDVTTISDLGAQQELSQPVISP